VKWPRRPRPSRRHRAGALSERAGLIRGTLHASSSSTTCSCPATPPRAPRAMALVEQLQDLPERHPLRQSAAQARGNTFGWRATSGRRQGFIGLQRGCSATPRRGPGARSSPGWRRGTPDLCGRAGGLSGDGRSPTEARPRATHRSRGRLGWR
jgi:hypothetical protein